MRTIAFVAATLLAGAAGVAAAAPASVTVTISPELQAKAVKDYGVREVDRLADDLRKSVERQAAKAPAFDGARIVLELADAKPNRPTFKQLSDHPGLSFQSFSVGGAAIEGHAVLPGGRVAPLSYSYYETDIHYAHLAGVWGDAQAAIDGFATRLRRGDLVASR
jgi:hypothetical protein